MGWLWYRNQGQGSCGATIPCSGKQQSTNQKKWSYQSTVSVHLSVLRLEFWKEWIVILHYLCLVSGIFPMKADSAARQPCGQLSASDHAGMSAPGRWGQAGNEPQHPAATLCPHIAATEWARYHAQLRGAKICPQDSSSRSISSTSCVLPIRLRLSAAQRELLPWKGITDVGVEFSFHHSHTGQALKRSPLRWLWQRNSIFTLQRPSGCFAITEMKGLQQLPNKLFQHTPCVLLWAQIKAVVATEPEATQNKLSLSSTSTDSRCRLRAVWATAPFLRVTAPFLQANSYHPDLPQGAEHRIPVTAAFSSCIRGFKHPF